jgi:hypothetical protein
VESFRAVVDDESLRLREYIFLLLRVLVIRCTPKRADPLWPCMRNRTSPCSSFSFILEINLTSAVILCEIVKVFEAKEAALIVAATKLLDLMFLISNEQFNLWTWIFINDAAHAAKVARRDAVIIIINIILIIINYNYNLFIYFIIIMLCVPFPF